MIIAHVMFHIFCFGRISFSPMLFLARAVVGNETRLEEYGTGAPINILSFPKGIDNNDSFLHAAHRDYCRV